MAQASSPPTSPWAAAPAGPRRQHERSSQCWAPQSPRDAVHALRARSHFLVASPSNLSQSCYTRAEPNHSAHVRDAACCPGRSRRELSVTQHRLCRRSTMEAGRLRPWYVAACDPEHLQNPWERGKGRCNRAGASGDVGGGTSAGVRANASGYGYGRLSETRQSWGSTREKGNARKRRWKVPRVGRAYVRILL